MASFKSDNDALWLLVTKCAIPLTKYAFPLPSSREMALLKSAMAFL